MCWTNVVAHDRLRRQGRLRLIDEAMHYEPPQCIIGVTVVVVRGERI